MTTSNMVILTFNASHFQLHPTPTDKAWGRLSTWIHLATHFDNISPPINLRMIRRTQISEPFNFIMDVQQLFKNLKKEAECPLCIETVKNPKTLPCLHSCCLECLDKLAGLARRQLQTTIKCPVCQTSFQIPEGDTFNNLPTSFHLNRQVDVLALKDGSKQAQKCGNCDENNSATCYCFVCQNFLCKDCFESHQRLKATRGHRNVFIDKLQTQDVEELINRPVMCSQQYHENQPLEFYCEECKVPICHKCSVVNHNRHTMTDTQKAAQVQKMQMVEAAKKLKAETVLYENEIKKQIELMDKNKHEILSAEKKMSEAMEEMIRDLREHERKMKANLTEIYETQQKHHATRLKNFQLIVTQQKSCVEQGESILERNISAEILQTNQAIVGRCEELLNARKPEIYKPPHVHYILENKPHILDRIVVGNTDPSMSLAERQSKKEVMEGKETNFTIVTRDSDGLQGYHESDDIKVHILTPAGDQLKTDIKDTKDGRYTVTYTPQCAGQHRVEIQVNGKPLTCSPWVVHVPHQYQFAFQFGSTGKTEGEFDQPWDIAVSEKTGTIAVADSRNKRIQMFSPNGNFLTEIKLNNEPISLAFTESGDLIACVPDGENQLSLFTECGQFIKHINDKNSKNPFNISVGSDGRIITCDWQDNKIKVLSPDGNDLLQYFSAPDCGSPPWCAIYHQDTFFVSYLDANCVKVFNNAGVYQYDIGCEGDGQLSVPFGIAIDKFNQLIVCDGGNERLQLFTLDGKFVTKITGEYFVGILLFCVAVFKNRNFLVTDRDKNCIYVFH